MEEVNLPQEVGESPSKYSNFKCLFRDTDDFGTMCVSYPDFCEDCIERLFPCYTIQSEEISVEQNVEFIDESGGDSVGFYQNEDPVSTNDQTAPVELADFLSRPVPIANFDWAESDSVGTLRAYDPWYLFFNDARIKRKLDNFAFIQCDLKVKVMINASPFYYGAMLMNYIPLPSLTPSTIKLGVANEHLIPHSQRPHLWIYPQNNEAGEMVLPYFNYRNWLTINTSSDFTGMGQLQFRNYTLLRSANAALGAGVSVTVYAWAENIKLSGPTVSLALQSKDEYGEGVISKPASAVAYVASKLTDLPIIGPFARATTIGASAISSIASIFGFTNVPVIADTMPYRSTPFPQFSSPDISYPVEKLTLDPKNELSIDPRVAGLPGEDELVIANLVKKESYLTSFAWSTTDTTSTILFTSVVTPNAFDTTGGTNPKLYLTPMAWVGAMFQAWRGDIIFKFTFVASQYHKGRVRISYDPVGNIIADPDSTSVVFTEVVDLSKDTEVEIRVPYQQAIAWLLYGDVSFFNTPPYSLSASPGHLYNPSYHNGTIMVRVLNKLSAPVTLSTINCLVSVRGADNLEFANPRDISDRLTTYEVQSSDEVITIGAPRTPDDNRYLVNWGEAIVSLRQILRRSSLNATYSPATLASTNLAVVKNYFTKWPVTPGYDPTGLDIADGLVVPASTFPYNFTHNTPYTWLAPAYVGQRGSMIWHFNVENTSECKSVKVVRANAYTGQASNTITQIAKGTSSSNSRFYNLHTWAGSSGQSLTNQVTQAGISVLCPNYSPYRFQGTRSQNSTFPQSTAAENLDNSLLELSYASVNTATTNLKISKFSSIGTDFNLLFFLNVPTYTIYSAIPPAV